MSDFHDSLHTCNVRLANLFVINKSVVINGVHRKKFLMLLKRLLLEINPLKANTAYSQLAALNVRFVRFEDKHTHSSSLRSPFTCTIVKPCSMWSVSAMFALSNIVKVLLLKPIRPSCGYELTISRCRRLTAKDHPEYLTSVGG